MAEFKFFDIRFGVLYITLGVWGLSRWFKTQASPPHFQDQKVRFLIGLFVIAFVMWMTASSIYRYLLTLEFLTPILFLALVERIVPARKIQAALIVTVTAGLLLLF